MYIYIYVKIRMLKDIYFKKYFLEIVSYQYIELAYSL